MYLRIDLLYKRFLLLILLSVGLLVINSLFNIQTKKRIAKPTTNVSSLPVPAKLKKNVTSSPAPVKLKKILYWNTYFGQLYFGFGIGRKPFKRDKCLNDGCLTVDRNVFKAHDEEEYDAIVFHGVSFPSPEGDDIPKSRKIRQRYVFFLTESPPQVGSDLRSLPSGFFNWTMTYRLDSDILNVYGTFSTLTKPTQHLIPPIRIWKTISNKFKYDDLPENTRSTIINKTKMVAWFVSHCDTQGKRELYIEKLQNYIPVDIYGKCGSLRCPSYPDSHNCYTLLEKTYKFYLSFENSICHDYVTEKFFNVMMYNVVPIVYGGANYSQLAPPGSYIDVKDFDSPQHLAEHLLHLASHPEEYAKHFWWRSHYKAVMSWDLNFCRLCEMLHDENLPQKSYADIQDWYNPPGTCQSPKDYLRINSTIVGINSTTKFLT